MHLLALACFVAVLTPSAPWHVPVSRTAPSNPPFCSRREVFQFLSGFGVCLAAPTMVQAAPEPPVLRSDEVEITFAALDQRIGLELDEKEVFYNNRRSRRVFVMRVLPGSQAAAIEMQRGTEAVRISPGFIVVSINGQNVEGATVVQVRDLIRGAARPVTIRFRDPLRFNELLTASESSDVAEVSTAIKGDDQIFKVERLSVPPMCTKGAEDGDLMEVGYTLSLLNGTLVDGSAITVGGRGVPGRGGDSSVYFVLGQQSTTGQVPAAWDVGLRGACVGERRKLTVPSTLAYGPTGLKRRRIPPDATLIYDMTVLSINAVSLPQ